MNLENIKNWFKKRRRITVSTEFDAELTPSVVIITTPKDFNYKVVEEHTYQGLLHVQALSGGGGNNGRILTVWRNNNAYDANEDRFLKDIKTKNDKVVFKGFHLGTHEGEKSFWKHLNVVKIWAIIASFFLVLGWVKEFRDVSGWLFLPPMIDWSIQPTPINVLVGKRFEFQVKVRNIRQIGECSIELASQNTDNPNDLSFDPITDKTRSAIKPNKIADLRIFGTAHNEGIHWVTINVQATGGFFSRKKEFEKKTKIRAWRSLAIGSRRVENIISGGKLCEGRFELHSGKRFPHGIEMEAKLERFEDVCFLGVRFPGTNDFTPYKNLEEKGKEVAILKWRTPIIAPMRVVPYTIILKSVGQIKTQDEWEAVLQSILFTLDPAR